MAAKLKTNEDKLNYLYEMFKSRSDDLEVIEVIIGGESPSLDITKPAPKYGQSPWEFILEREKGDEESILFAIYSMFEPAPSLQKKMDKMWSHYYPSKPNATGNTNVSGVSGGPGVPTPEEQIRKAIDTKNEGLFLEYLDVVSDDFLKTLSSEDLKILMTKVLRGNISWHTFLRRFLPLKPTDIASGFFAFDSYANLEKLLVKYPDLLESAFQHLPLTFLDGTDTGILKAISPSSIVMNFIYPTLLTPVPFETIATLLHILFSRGYDPFVPMSKSTLGASLFKYSWVDDGSKIPQFREIIMSFPDRINGQFPTITPLMAATVLTGGQELVTFLIENGADINLIVTIPDLNGKHTAFTYAFYHGYENVMRGNRSQDDFDASIAVLVSHPQFDLDVNLGVVKELYTKLPTSRRVKAMYEMLIKIKRSRSLYEGYTREDILEFNGVLQRPFDYSICPVCLATVVRPDGCMYMRHHCPSVSAEFDEELYERYKDYAGQITWCSYCSRICTTYATPGGFVGHYHYPLTLWSDPNPGKKATALPGAEIDHFAKDCVAQGGGGTLEKFTRIRRLREVAFELQDEVGKMTQYEAKIYAIREMWNSFTQRKPQAKKIMDKAAEIMASTILPAAKARQKANANAGRRPANAPIEFTDEELSQLNSIWGAFNRATANFPTANTQRAKKAAEAAAAENAKLTARAQANLPRPNQDPLHTPVRHTEYTCLVCLDPDHQPTWQFRHIQKNGTLNTHEGEEGVICEYDLENYIRNSLAEKGLPRFGYCWKDDCNALLWPQEVQGKIPADLFEKYRVEFNKAMLSGRLQSGGRMQHGGTVPFLTVISQNTVESNSCPLPKKRSGGTRRRLKRGRKTQRRRRN